MTKLPTGYSGTIKHAKVQSRILGQSAILNCDSADVIPGKTE